MKQPFVTALMAVALLTACTDDQSVFDGSPVEISFAITGDFTFSTAPFTRSLTADGKDMTDVWVLDYVNNTLQQQVHQTSSDADFGTPTLSLAIGTHHLYFIASRGQTPTLNTIAHTLSFVKVLDTFYKDYQLTVTTGTSSGSRSIVLDRVVTKLKVIFTDAIPTGASTFNVTPATWYSGINYETGEPCAAVTSQPITVNIPTSEIGVVNEAINIYGFSSATEWTTDVSINCKTSDNTVLGYATITAAPFVRNRVSEYTGPLFGDNGSMTLSLNIDWTTSHTGTW